LISSALPAPPMMVVFSFSTTTFLASPRSFRVTFSSDRPTFGKYSGTEVKVEGEDLVVMREEDVMAVIESK